MAARLFVKSMDWLSKKRIIVSSDIPLLKEEGAKREPDRAKPQEKGGIKR
jgi:hypothetical protein